MLGSSQALVNWLQPYADAVELPYLPAHVPTVLRSLIFFCSLQVLSSGLSTVLLPRAMRRLSPKARTQWDVHVVSFVHSAVIGPLSLYFWYYGVENIHRALGYDYTVAQIYATSLGYFFWDIYISARYDGLAFVIHGVLASLGIVCVFRPVLMIDGLSFLTWELSTPFLNIHWFLDKLFLTGSWMQLVCAVFLLISYVSVRLVLGIFQTFKIISLVWDPANNVPPFQRTLYTVGPIVLDFLNYLWFFKMLRAVQKRFLPAKQPAEKKQAAKQ